MSAVVVTPVTRQALTVDDRRSNGVAGYGADTRDQGTIKFVGHGERLHHQFLSNANFNLYRTC